MLDILKITYEVLGDLHKSRMFDPNNVGIQWP